MIVRDLYEHAVSMTSTAAELARAAAFRTLFGLEYERQVREDEALAALRALGDDGTHLRQAVTLAAAGVTDEQVEAFTERAARGEEAQR